MYIIPQLGRRLSSQRIQITTYASVVGNLIKISILIQSPEEAIFRLVAIAQYNVRPL